jgi:SPP1 family phage portal protein
MIKAKLDPQTLTPEKVYKLIDEYTKSDQYTSFLIAQNYYEGAQNILNRTAGSTNTDVNNKLVNNFPGYIVDVNVGYFMGKPVAYTSAKEDKGFTDELQNIFDYNDEQDENMELAKIMGIKGRSYELLYADEDAKVRFAAIQPENLIMIYNALVEPEPIVAIRFWYTPDLFSDDIITNASVYTDTEIISYQGTGDALVETGRVLHSFGAVPVIEFQNNDERQGDFDKVIQLIDAYDKVQSDMANDFESFADAFLLIRNMSGTDDEDLKDMRKRRVILVDDDGDANWLVKDVNDAAQENYKERLQEDIHRFSLTPNLTDEKFAGNVSGIALQFKLWGIEQKAAQKERKFKRALQRRIELITNFLGVKGKQFDWREVSIVFTRNAPPALPEIVDMVIKLRDFISDETLRAALPFIEDPVEEGERVELQREGKINLDNYNPIRATGFVTEEEEEENEITPVTNN